MEALALNVESPRSTSSRRRISTINTRALHGDSEKEWTATRCNRLLRALTSRVAILKKDISRLQSTTCPKSSAAGPSTGHRQKRGNTSPGNADWAHPRKKIRRTYSARGGRTNNGARAAFGGVHASLNDGRRLAPGDISVPTPLLHRARGEHTRSHSLPPVSANGSSQNPEGQGEKDPRLRDGEAHFQLSKTMRDIRKSTPPNRYTTYEGIYYGLEGLLRATVPGEEGVSPHGPQSLLSMCLRAIPHCISREEAVLTAQLEETGSKSAIYQRDVSTEIYDDLEALGSSGHGWKHLRTVVRSHGIQVICTAIKEGLIDTEFCEILVTLCLNMCASREAETLLSAQLSARVFSRPKSVYTRFDDDPATHPLSMLSKFIALRGGSNYQYRQLSSMIANGSLPITWLATKEFVMFWGVAILEFASESVDPDAITFFVTVLPLLATYGDSSLVNSRAVETTDVVLLEAVKQTFTRLIAAFLAVVILSKEKIVDAQGSVVSPPDYKEITTLFQTCLVQWRLYNSLDVKGALFALILLTLQHYDGSSPDADTVDLLLKHLRHTKRSTQLYTPRNDLIVLACSIARCCGKGASTSGFEYLQQLHILLETISQARESNGRRIVHEIIVDSAFAFARQVPNRGHLEYATSIEEKLHVMKPEARDASPSENDDNMAGYRWEEGISEWVITTPAPSSVKSAWLEDDSSVDDSECDTPFYHPSRRARSKYLARSTLITDLASSPDPDREHNYRNTARPSTPEYDSTASDSYSDEGDTDIANTPIESPVSSASHEAYESDDALPVDSSPGEDLETDELGLPDSPLQTWDTSHGVGNSRRHVDRAPRLSNRVLRHSLHWELVDGSDDELSCLSTLSKHNSPRQSSRNGSGTSSKSQDESRVKRVSNRGKSTVGLETSFLGESEDELGV